MSRILLLRLISVKKDQPRRRIETARATPARTTTAAIPASRIARRYDRKI